MEKRIIGFFGGDSQVGTSMIAQSVGEEFCVRNIKTLLILLSGKCGDDFIANKEGHSLDELKAELLNENLDSRDFKQVLCKEGNLYILPGVNNFYTAEYYTGNAVRCLIDECKKTFDAIIIDCGESYRLDYIQELLENCEERIFIIDQRAKTLRRFLYIKDNFLSIDKCNLNEVRKDRVIVNKQRNNLSLYKMEELKKILRLDRIWGIPYIERGWQSEIEKRTLMKYKSFRTGIEEVVDDIVEERGERKQWIENFKLLAILLKEFLRKTGKALRIMKKIEN